jgi:hypothetical protein
MFTIPDPSTATEQHLYAFFAMITEHTGVETCERLLHRSLLDFRDPHIRTNLLAAQETEEKRTRYLFGVRISVVRPSSSEEDRIQDRYYIFYSDGSAEVFLNDLPQPHAESVFSWQKAVETFLLEISRLLGTIASTTDRCMQRFGNLVIQYANQEDRDEDEECADVH